MQFLKSFLYRLPLLAALFSLSSCLNGTLIEQEKEKGPSLFVIFSDYKSGMLRSLTLDSLKYGADSLQVNQDSRVLSLNGSVYVLERFGADNILKYDPQTMEVKYQHHLGDRWNPSDLVAWKGSTGFVSLEDHPVVLKYDLDKGSIIDSLDIAKFSHTGDSGIASSPNAVGLAMKGDFLYIALGRRNKAWQLPGGKSMVLIVNASSFSIVDSLVAPGTNGAEMWVSGDDLYFSCPNGIDSLNDGAIYRWNLTTKAMTTVITEAKLGGHINSIACEKSGQCAAAVYRGWTDVPVRRFNLSTGIAEADFLPGIKDAFGGLTINPATGYIYIAERKADGSGIIMFDDKGKKLHGPVSAGLPPSSISVLQD